MYIEHWDHVMTFPAPCEHAMQVMNTHLSQIKVNQNDLEARLAVMDRLYGEEKAKAAVDAENEADWAKNANNTGSQNKKDSAYVQTDAKVNTEEKSDRKAKQTTNTSAQVAADLEKEKS